MNPALRIELFAFPIEQLTNENCFFNATKSDRQTRVVGNRAARIPDKLSKSQIDRSPLRVRATRILTAVVDSRIDFCPLRAAPRPPMLLQRFFVADPVDSRHWSCPHDAMHQ